jgi:hypothetical protein
LAERVQGFFSHDSEMPSGAWDQGCPVYNRLALSNVSFLIWETVAATRPLTLVPPTKGKKNIEGTCHSSSGPILVSLQTLFSYPFKFAIASKNMKMAQKKRYWTKGQ